MSYNFSYSMPFSRSTLLSLVTALAALVTQLFADDKPSDRAALNVVVITIDTLRAVIWVVTDIKTSARRISMRSPADGVRFEHAYTPVPSHAPPRTARCSPVHIRR